MAKLYAELTSDKGGRVASKGGDKWLNVDIRNGNLTVARILYTNDSIIVNNVADGTQQTIKLK